MNYQPAKFQCYKLSLAGFIDIKKTQWWRHNDVISCWCDLEISNVVKLTLNIGYHLSKLQMSWISGSSFIKVSVRPLNTIMTSLWCHVLSLCFQIKTPKHHYGVMSYHCVSKLAHFLEHGMGYHPSKFQCPRMSVLWKGGRKDPQC